MPPAGVQRMRVVEEVGDDLLDARLVGHDRGQGVDAALVGEAPRRRPRAPWRRRRGRARPTDRRAPRSSLKRCVSRRARSSRSATSRLEAGRLALDRRQRARDVLLRHHPVRERRRVAADRRQRGAQVVGDAHEELARLAVALGEPAHHEVEVGGQLVELLRAGGAQLGAHVALGDPVGGRLHGGQRARDPAGQQEHDGQRHGQPDARRAHDARRRRPARPRRAARAGAPAGSAPRTSCAEVDRRRRRLVGQVLARQGEVDALDAVALEHLVVELVGRDRRELVGGPLGAGRELEAGVVDARLGPDERLEGVGPVGAELGARAPRRARPGR